MEIAMLKTLIPFVALAISTSAFAYPIALDDVELNSKGAFVDCQLKNKSSLYANLDMVIYNNEILSKRKAPTAFTSRSAENLLYNDHQYQVLVSKQFCGREGIQAVRIINKLTGEKIESVCESKNLCK